MKLFGDFLGTSHLFNNIRLSNFATYAMMKTSILREVS